MGAGNPIVKNPMAKEWECVGFCWIGGTEYEDYGAGFRLKDGRSGSL